jgi:hypothetical protein
MDDTSRGRLPVSAKRYGKPLVTWVQSPKAGNPLTLDKTEIFGKLHKMSELGDRYRLAEQIVLQKYSLEKDEQGRSQYWKVAAIEEDRRLKHDSHILQSFVEDVEATVDRLTIKTPIVSHKSPLVATTIVNHVSQSHTVAAEPLSPVKPHPPQQHDGINPS